MALTNNEKQEALRKRMAKLGLKRKEFWLTDSETLQMKDQLSIIRSKAPGDRVQ